MAGRSPCAVFAGTCFLIVSLLFRYVWTYFDTLNYFILAIYGILICSLFGIGCLSADLYRCTPEGVSYPLTHQIGIYIYKKWLTYLYVYVIHGKFIKQTKTCKLTQEAYLLEHLQKNGHTVYGSKYRFSDIKSRDDYVKSVPLIKQADIAPYCQRIARGEKNILTKEDPAMMALTTGTTGDNCPIPVIKSSVMRGMLGVQAVTFKSLMEITKCKPEIRKDIFLILVSKMGETEGGLTLAPLSYLFMKDGTKSFDILSTTPLSSLTEVTSRQDMLYLAMLFSIADKSVGSITSVFAIHVVTAFQTLEDNWERMVQEIREGHDIDL